MKYDVAKIRKDFPPLKRRIKGKPILYFDNACMTLKPEPVISSMKDYYENYPGCHGRTDHTFGRETTEKYNRARQIIKRFLGAKSKEEIVFTRNTTEGINLISRSFPFQSGDVVVSSDIEHNSNLLPWQRLSKEKGVRHIIIPTRRDTTFQIDELKRVMDDNVKLISLLQVSNLTGVCFPIQEICELAHRYGTLVLVDGAQSALYKNVNVHDLDVDFYVFSMHKVLGPTGMGVLYGKKHLLSRIAQFLSGGETVTDSTYTSAEIARSPDKFEAGLQNYAGAIGSAAAIEYVESIGRDRIEKHISGLNKIATSKLIEMKGITILGPQEAEKRGGIVNVLVEGINCMDLSRILNDTENIMVRFGKHCVHSWYNARRVPDSLRLSFSLYNTEEEIEIFLRTFQNIIRYFR